MEVKYLPHLALFTHVLAFAPDGICNERFEKWTSLKPTDCKPNYYYFPKETYGCLPKCVFLKPGLTTTQPCAETKSELRCPPGYRCEGADPLNRHCRIDEDSCFKFTSLYPDAENKYKLEMWKPTCLEDGSWAPRQCKGELSNGRCFCYDRRGRRLPGQQFYSRAENMTCACSRMRAEQAEKRNNWFVSLHCDDEGNFEPLQCNQGQCWCVLPRTGDVVSPIVPEKMWHSLPCYNRELSGETYLRQCESHQYAQEKLRRHLMLHGTINFQMAPLVCDGDGTYGPYSFSDNVATCVWKDNKPLGPWHVQVDNANPLNTINCNCAKDKRVFENAGLNLNLHCDQNGNYYPLQSTTIAGVTWYFCVDSDGFQNSNLKLTPSEIADCGVHR